MLTFWGGKQHGYCDRMSRRSFLRVGALGTAGLTLADLLRLEAQGAASSESSHKAVIMVYLGGGPPHLDMYDMKPDAPAEYRGEFKQVQTNAPGLDLCELFPEQAKIGDKLAVVRNMYWGDTDQGHQPGKLYTGTSGRPAFGSMVSKVAGGHAGGLPPYVALGSAGEPLYLGAAHAAFTPSGPGLANLTLAKGITPDRLRERRALLDGFDSLRREVDDRAGQLAAVDSFTARALEMVTTNQAREAFDVSKEPEAIRKTYGYSTCLLQALRLVQAGVRVVTTSLNGYTLLPPTDGESWDTHGKNFAILKQKLLPPFDRAIAALVNDIYRRGLDEDVAVVVWGEMGRTPRINASAGRDHWPWAGFALLAGGGFKTGQTVGATDAKGERVKGARYTQENVLATLYGVLGIDPAATVPDNNGRPVHLLDDRNPVRELL